ncbi:MAG: MBL fold metallo-hydrolase [Clostridium sp.]|jgi:glyoxylase-like metal-dependent hydrolase (beta-lactamase superfamily II)|nr:MBL fold metallo-hydrolase [Clostridium sp.]
MIVKQVITGEIQENCYIVIDEKTKKAFMVDPGDEGDRIAELVDSLGIKLEYILLTHGHFDHVGAVEYIADKYNIPFYISEVDEKWAEKVPSLFGKLRKADGYLKDGDTIIFGNKNIEVFETPGHTEGGLCFLIDNVLLTGDTLFRASIGRTDFPGGNFKKIIESIKNKLLGLGDDIVVYPGHGPSSTIAFEKERNPYLD